MVQPIPPGFNSVSVYLIVPNAVEATEFYVKAFGATPISRMPGPDGTSTVHAEIRIGDSTVMLTDENPEWGSKSPQTLGGTPAGLHLYVADADAAYARATEAGCTAIAEIADAFWGDRYAKVKDPFGHEWGIATRKEELTEAEINERAAAWFAQMAGE